MALAQRVSVGTGIRNASGPGRHRRRLPVLRRRRDHAGDLGAVGGRGPGGLDARTAAIRAADQRGGDRGAVRRAVARHRQRRPRVRPGDGGVVRRDRRARASLEIVRHPFVLLAISPSYAVALCIEYKGLAFIVLGAVVLCVTGAEALYADMGHFGAHPIRLTWTFFVLPCLVLNYFGQGALIDQRPRGARQSVLPAGAALAAPAAGGAGHDCDGHRQPGGDLRRLLDRRGSACSSASCRA